MKNEKRDKLISIRINKNLYDNIILLNRMQIEYGHKYSIQDTINFILQKTNGEIILLKEKNEPLFL